MQVPLDGEDSMDFIIDIDIKNRSFSLIANGMPFKELPFESSIAPQGSDRITGGKLIINAKIVHQGPLHWDGAGRINDKYQNVLGNEKATSIVFDGLECSSSRVSDELLAFLVGMVDDNNLKVLSFRDSFNNGELPQFLVKSLAQHASATCHEICVSKSGRLSCAVMLDMVAHVCCSSDYLTHLGIIKADASSE